MKVVFFGTPDFAVPSLLALINKHDVVGVVCQPDKRGDRNKIVVSKVKEIAIENNIPIFQFEKISKEGHVLSSLGADIFVTCAYGQILSKNIIEMCEYGIINVHASLLPRYRGSTPIQWSIINGDKETGVTIMQTEEGIDTGDILHVIKTDIKDDETSGELFCRMSVLGAEALIVAMDKIIDGSIVRIKQDDSKASYVKIIKKSDGIIDWNKSAQTLYDFIRGLNPWPCAYTYYKGQVVKILSGRAEYVKNRRLYAPGEVIEACKKTGLLIACTSGSAYRVNMLQMQNCAKMKSSEYLNGHNIDVGYVFGSDT